MQEQKDEGGVVGSQVLRASVISVQASQVLIKSPGSRQAARHAQNELDLVVAQLREDQQSLHDKKQLLAEALREKQHL